ncbi:hypothetical protein [Variovorax sp. OAS795]|uniref:hypothetical protein n=1 Tax=Variovorax sp. OAS795 TaxID=3034231 RepID=UPI003390FBBB
MELTPNAARIAALLLVADDTIPEPLRRSLGIALSAAGEAGEAPGRWKPDDPDTAAARAFVEACVEVARRLAIGDAR